MEQGKSLLELAERCEQASGPDRELDLDITEALDLAGRAALSLVPFTASLNAAMTLVPEGCSWSLHKHNSYSRAGVFVDDGRDPGHYCDAATPALALCAAALRARAAMGDAQ
jgi:hypothetical protein